MTRGAISKLVDHLFKKGLIERIESLTDRRYQEIKLTSKGKHLLPQLAALADSNDQYYFKCLTADQKQEFKSLLKKIVEANQMKQTPID